MRFFDASFAETGAFMELSPCVCAICHHADQPRLKIIVHVGDAVFQERPALSHVRREPVRPPETREPGQRLVQEEHAAGRKERIPVMPLMTMCVPRLDAESELPIPLPRQSRLVHRRRDAQCAGHWRWTEPP
jgi:hypothetical protein